jgi:hypothetical protein
MKGRLRIICFSRSLRAPDELLQLNDEIFTFVNNVAYPGVTFDRRMALR